MKKKGSPRTTRRRRASAKSRTKISFRRPKKNSVTFAGERKNIQPRSFENLGDLPFSYNQTKLVALVRDPEWAFVYWDFSGETWKWIQDFLRQDAGARPKLRAHNLDRGNFFDVDVNLEAKSWYLNLGLPDTNFEIELGILDSRGKFHLIARANRIRTPRSGPSNVVDPNWLPEDFDELYRLSGGGRTGAGSEIFSRFKRP